MSHTVHVGLAIWPSKSAQWFALGLNSREGIRISILSQEKSPHIHEIPCDLLLVDGDSPGPSFISYYNAHVEKFGIPFLIVLGQPGCPAMMSVEWDPETTVYIAKPFLIEDVLKTINQRLDEMAADSIHPLTHHAPAPSPPKPPRSKSLGYLSTLRLSDLLQMLCLSNWSGRIEAKNLTSGESGTVAIHNGALIHARSGAWEGEKACHKMLAWGRCEFAFVEEEQSSTPVNIRDSLQGVLLEAARLVDEDNRR